MSSPKRSYVAGHTGMVGSALVRRLGNESRVPDRRFDLRDEDEAIGAMVNTDPERVYLAAALVGGIGANESAPIAFLEDNLKIGMAILPAAFACRVREFLNFGSSCIYPRDAPQPLREEYLLTGPLEPTNEAYALAKIVTLKLVEYYRQTLGVRYFSVMPTNLYGPGDRYDLDRSHVLPAMILKFERARLAGAGTVELWGTGKPMREFLFVDDLADAAVLVMDEYDGAQGGWLNVGSGEELSIADLAGLVAKATGYTGTVSWNGTRIDGSPRPDGTPRKLLDSSKIRELGWAPKIKLQEGLEIAVDDYRRRHP